MRERRPAISGLLALLIVTATASTAAAHCCHDIRNLGVFEQDAMRHGLHGLDKGLGEDSVDTSPPSVGTGLGASGIGGLGGGGVGQMQGNGLGSYGAGSIGEPGPGGLGALHGDNIGRQPPRPR